MAARFHSWRQGNERMSRRLGVLVLLGCLLSLSGCSPSGNTGASHPDPPELPITRRGLEAVQRLYHQALLQEDIDRLQDLFPPPVNGVPQPPAGFTDVETFREQITTLFRTRILLDLHIPTNMIHIDTAQLRVSFREVESVEDPVLLAQQTQVFDTTLHIARHEDGDRVAFYIEGVRRQGPLVQLSTRGQMQTAAWTRLHVTPGSRAFADAAVKVPETGTVYPLQEQDRLWQGVFQTPPGAVPRPLEVQLRYADDGTMLVVPFRYRLRDHTGPIVQPIALGRGVLPHTAFFAIAAERDTIWAGGDATQPGTIGTVVSLDPTSEPPLPRLHHFTIPPQRGPQREMRGQIVDIAIDAQPRQHFLFLVRTPQGIVGAGDLVRDPAFPDTVCQTVNAFARHYPLKGPDGLASPSTRLVAAGESRVWLYGSDAGITWAQDTFQEGECHKRGATYGRPPIRRSDDRLLSNTVPALIVAPGDDRPQWFGTILGLQNRDFTAFPFTRNRPNFRDVATLEQYFDRVAAALFEARPLATTQLGNVRFPEPLIKEDLIFSLLADRRGRVWIGTLGGGLRCHGTACPTPNFLIQRCNPSPQDPEQLLCHGLPSNLVIALAEGQDGAIWAATAEGASRIEVQGARVTTTTFTPLDGLAAPVWEVAADSQGTVWFATAEGLSRLLPQGATLTGCLRDSNAAPIAGVDVLVQGTALRAVTDERGCFMLWNVPLGAQILIFDSPYVRGTPFTRLEWSIFVIAGTQELPPVRLTHGLQLTAQAQEPNVPVKGSVGLIAQVTNGGRPVANKPVHFRVRGGGATQVEPEMVPTNAQGLAITTLHVRERGPQQIDIRSGEMAPVLLTVVGRPPQESVTLRISGNTQLGVPGQELKDPLVVQILDELGAPLPPGVLVTAAVLSDEPDEGLLPNDRRHCTSAGIKRQTCPTEADGAQFRLRVGFRSRTVRMRVEASGVATEFRIEVTRFLTGNRPIAVAVADFNDDNKNDIVTANADDDTVSFLQGKGNGTMAPARDFPVGARPTAIGVADLNRDRQPDIVTANAGDDTVSFLKGLGNGTFAEAIHCAVGDGSLPNEPTAIAVEHLDDDGFRDVVTANAASRNLSLLRGRATTDTEPCPVAFAEFVSLDGMDDRLRPRAIVVVDLDQDGRLDLVTTNAADVPDAPAGNVAILFGNGAGRFDGAQFVEVGAFQQPVAVAIKDLNGDGRLDLVTANVTDTPNGADDSLSHNLAIVLGRGQRTFALAPLLRVGPAPTAVALADLDVDGHVDLIVASRDNDDVLILSGRGDGTFAAGQRRPTGDGPVALAVADLDTDVPGRRRLDVVVADTESSDVTILLGQPEPLDALFETKPRQLDEVGAHPVAIALTARVPENVLAMVTANAVSNDVVILSGTNGAFTQEQRLRVGITPAAVAVAQLNNGGAPEVITVNQGSCDVSVLFGNADGSWTFERRVQAGLGPQHCPVALAVTPRVPGGAVDVVTANAGSNEVALLVGRGDGTFEDAQFLAVGREPVAVIMADVNGDGTPDIVTANATSHDVTVRLGSAAGTFAPARHFPVAPGRRPVAVAVADVNGDGVADLVTANEASSDVAVLLGQPAHPGTFAAARVFAGGPEPIAITVLDLNRDGRQDVITVNATTNSLSVLLGWGNGAFALPQRVKNVGALPMAVAAAHFASANGPVELLVTANAESNDVTVMLGRGDGTLAFVPRTDVDQNPVALAVAVGNDDLNHDGKTDVVTANSNANSITILLGNGQGDFLRVRHRMVCGESPGAIAVADINGDGWRDIITANVDSNNIAIMTGRPDGTLAPAVCYPQDNTLQRPVAVAVTDLDGDGALDIITANAASDQLAIFWGPDIQDQNPMPLSLGTRCGPTDATDTERRRPAALVIADLDGNQHLDLITANAVSNDVSILWGQGARQFNRPPHPTPCVPIDDGRRPTAVAVATAAQDLNRDGRPDLVTANNSSANLSILLQGRNNRFTLQSPVGLNGAGRPRAVAVADLNGDGRSDLVAAAAGSDDIAILLGNGDGTFAPGRRLRVRDRPAALAVVDLNGDRILDIVAAHANSDDVVVLLGLGDGTFRTTSP